MKSRQIESAHVSWDQVPPRSARQPADDRPLLRRLSSRLLRLAPRFAVRAFARPYIAGETRADAVALANGLFENRGISSTLDVLGEDITDAAEKAVDCSLTLEWPNGQRLGRQGSITLKGYLLAPDKPGTYTGKLTVRSQNAGTKIVPLTVVVQ